MGLLDEWNKVKKNENNRAEVKKWALTKGAPKTQQSYFGKSAVSPDIMTPTSGQSLAEQRAKSMGPYHSNGDRSRRGTLPPGWRERNAAITAQQEQQSFMDALLGGITEQYQPPQRPDMSAQIAEFRAGLDAALAARLQALGGIRNNAQQGYNTSDANLAAMFQQNANNIATQGSQRFTDITAGQKQGIAQTRDDTINTLQGDRQKQMAERAEMLSRLGIQDSAAGPDIVSDTLSQGVQRAGDRANINLNMADTMGASNQAYNQSVVNSVNQQGAERRAALTQQLQAIQNQLAMAEAEATSQTEQAKANGVLEMQQAMASAPDNGYDVFRDRQSNLMDIYKIMIDQQNQEAQQTDPTQVRGFGGLAQDLLNSGIDQNAAAGYMNTLSGVLGSEYMQGIHPDEGYDRASVIARRLIEQGVPQVIAGQLATNYANLGNNAYYTAQ